MDDLQLYNLGIDELNHQLQFYEDKHKNVVKRLNAATDKEREYYSDLTRELADIAGAIRYELGMRGETPRPRWNVKQAFDTMTCPRCGGRMEWGGYIDNYGESVDKWIECPNCELSLWAPVPGTYPID